MFGCSSESTWPGLSGEAVMGQSFPARQLHIDPPPTAEEQVTASRCARPHGLRGASKSLKSQASSHPPTPEMALLHHKLDTIPKQFHYPIVQILTAARMTIASLWKTNIAPNCFGNSQKSAKKSARYEQILAHSTDSLQKCNKRWKCWSCIFPIRDT